MNWHEAAEEAKQAELAEEGWVDVMCKFLSYGNLLRIVSTSPPKPPLSSRSAFPLTLHVFLCFFHADFWNSDEQ